jgi:plastocyanin
MVRTILRLLAATSLVVALAAAPASPAAAGGGCHGEDGSVHTEGPSTVVKMELCSFVPTVVHVPLGTTVRFLNSAPIEHLVVGERRTWGTDDTLQPGDEISHRFDGPGVFPFSCPLHPGMVGAIVVGGADAAGAAPGAPASAPSAGLAADADPALSAASTAATPWAPVAGLVVLVVAIAVVAGGILAWRHQAHRGLASREP